MKDARPDPGYLCDSRDLLISLNFKSIVQAVQNRADGTFRIVWFREGADSRFSEEDKRDIEKAFAAATSQKQG